LEPLRKGRKTMAKTVKYWVFVREDGMPRQVCVEIPSSTELVPEAGRWVEMTGELPEPKASARPGVPSGQEARDGMRTELARYDILAGVSDTGCGIVEEDESPDGEYCKAEQAMAIISDLEGMVDALERAISDLTEQIDALEDEIQEARDDEC
jgi:hypothetical protein